MGTIGVVALARSTFDVPFAQEMTHQAFAALDRTGNDIKGPRTPAFDAEAAEAALDSFGERPLDLLLLLQVTFTDAATTVRIAQRTQAPLAIWALPEPRTGGRLRLNGFCGLNLAAHALGLADKPFRWLYAAPNAEGIEDRLTGLVQQGSAAEATLVRPPLPSAADRPRAQLVRDRLSGARIGLIGEHPTGFDTCRYDAGELEGLAGVTVAPITLPALFEAARAVPAAQIAATRASVAREVGGLDEVDQAQLDRSLSVYRALDGLAREQGLSALAVRCWPEMFTELGCAACGPMGLMNAAQVPSACEADVYGALTALALQALAGEPSFLVDVMDMREADDTAVVWHCGLAPLSMADPATPPIATVHSNRRMPLLAEFALKPGRVTVARISQARNSPKLVLAGATMLSAPKSFSGTSGVLRFDRPIPEVTATLMDLALEHHVTLVYGDVRGALAALGQAMGLPVVALA